jgi:hypothetical protein
MIFGVYAYKQPARGGTTNATNNTTFSEYKDTVDYKILESLF